MEPTDHNRRAFDDAHRTSENVLQVPGMPDRIRERLQGASGHRVLHLFSGTGRESVDLADLGALVTGVDDDEASIESARRRAPESELRQMLKLAVPEYRVPAAEDREVVVRPLGSHDHPVAARALRIEHGDVPGFGDAGLRRPSRRVGNSAAS